MRVGTDRGIGHTGFQAPRKTGAFLLEKIMTQILKLDAGGVPQAWISLNDAISYHATDSVAWQYGDHEFVYRGGYQDGKQSIIKTASIIAVKSETGFAVEKVRKDVVLTNRTLFGRDRYTCAYCGRTFAPRQLSRDHIVPTSRGGLNVWMNCVSACFDCNCDKDDRMLSECGMHLLYVPYVPSHAERLILEGRNVLSDQMDFLRSRLGKNSRLL